MAFTIFSYHALFSAWLILFDHLATKTNYVEAAGKNIGFTIELIHRDFPRSPFYNPSDSLSDVVARAIRHSNSRADYLRSSSIPSSTKSIRSQLVPNAGSYLMSLSFGTPPVETFAIADTGSDLIWIQCKPCDACYTQDASLFNPAQSSTYGNLSCQSTQCQSLPQSTCDGNRSCGYSYAYGDQSYTNGVLASETLTFNSTERRPTIIPKIAFGCGHNNGGPFDEHGTGLVGLGGGSLSLISQLGSSIEGKFSYCLVPIQENVTSSSQLNFGDSAVVSGSGVVSTPLIPKEPHTFYYLTLEEIEVGKAKVRLPTAAEGGNIIVDSGTTLTYLETSVYKEFVVVVNASVPNLVPAQDPSQTFDTCYEAGSADASFPDMTFRFAAADILLKPLNSFIQISEGVVCLAMSPMDNFSIFGNIAQQNFKVGCDLVGKKVFFVPTDCTKN